MAAKAYLTAVSDMLDHHPLQCYARVLTLTPPFVDYESISGPNTAQDISRETIFAAIDCFEKDNNILVSIIQHFQPIEV